MSVPLRNDDFEEEELTTADLAQSKRPVATEHRTGPQLAEPTLTEPTPLERSDAGSSVRAALRSDALDGERAFEINTRDGAALRTTSNAARSGSDAAPLFPSNELDGLRGRWNEVQAAFVDEPRRAVEQADGLVASAMKRLAEVFAEERSKLEKQWDRGDDVSTEDLRVALQKYRSFFQRLLSI
jgi:hypothetical protein